MYFQIGIKLIHENAKVPQAAHPGDAADLFAVEDVTLRPNAPVLVRTGLVLDLPAGWRAWITPRSGLALKHGVTVANAPGLIDSGYRGEVGVILICHSPAGHRVSAGDRVAQISFARVFCTDLIEVDEVSKTERGGGGFGSTGK
ncbi:MAG: dUTP diphosphatase [Bryobacterales bacterium]|nr:dUTP diphosphatase [Bryobacterales bacterium]